MRSNTVLIAMGEDVSEEVDIGAEASVMVWPVSNAEHEKNCVKTDA